MSSGDNTRTNSPLVVLGHTFPVTRLVAVIHLIIMLYALAFWIQIGVNPWLTKKLGVDSTVYGYLETTFAVLQLCGGPLFGRFGDLYGGRSALLLAYVSSTLMYVLLGLADSVTLLFVAKLPSLFMHSMQGGQMLATDLSTDSERADALGKLGVSYGVGMVLGPMIGGVVTQQTSPQFAALIAATLSALCVLMVFYFVPPRTKKVASQDGDVASRNDLGNLRVLIKLLKYPRIPFLLLVRVVTGIPLGVFQSMFSLVSIETFQVDPKESGYVLSYVGLLSLVMQGFGVGFMTRRFADESLLKIGACALVPYYLGLASMTAFHQIYLLVPFVVFAMATMNVVVTSSLTKSVTLGDTGAILGINMATNSLVRTVAPTVGGLLFANYGFSSFGFFGLGTTILVLGLLLSRSDG